MNNIYSEGDNVERQFFLMSESYFIYTDECMSKEVALLSCGDLLLL